MVEVTIYGTKSCPWCNVAKEFMIKNKVKFEYIDVGADREKAMEMIKKSGQMGVPVIDIGGEIIVGFNQPAIKRALNME